MDPIYDVEVFMTKLETFVKANLQTCIDDVQTEKGDSLVEAFDPESYRVWSMSDIPPFPLSYLQFIAGDPTIVSQSGGMGESYEYPIRLTCFVLETAQLNVAKKKARMNRILARLVREYIAPKFKNQYVQGTNMDSTLIRTQLGTVYETASIMMTIQLAF